jgi:hypothetical protein
MMDAALPPINIGPSAPAGAVRNDADHPPNIAIASVTVPPAADVGVPSVIGVLDSAAPAVAVAPVATRPIAEFSVRGGGRGHVVQGRPRGARGHGARGGGVRGRANAVRGRPSGAKNYRNEILINIIEEARPSGAEGWELVASRYREATNEVEFRDIKDLKEHWVRKLCNNFKKPTGRTGENGDRINRCIEIERAIQVQNEASIMGASSGEREDDGYNSSGVEAEEEDFFDVGGGDNEGGELAFDAGGGTVSTGTEGSINNSGSATTQDGGLCRRGSSGSSHLRSRSNTPVFNGSEGGKTKNSSNRDRASVGKSIQNLTNAMAERMTSGGGESGGMMTMQMQMMQQSQMQMQMQLNEMREQGRQSLKFLKVIAKQGKSKKRKGRSASSSSSLSSSDNNSVKD